MPITRLIAKWFKPEEIDFAALSAKVRQLEAGEISSFELPPGISYSRLVPECPKCGYRAEPGADRADRNAQDRRRMDEAGPHDGPDTHSDILRSVHHPMVSPLAQAEETKSGRGHGGILPASGNESRRASNADGRHGVPPLHVFVDRIHRRIMGRKASAAQGEAT